MGSDNILENAFKSTQSTTFEYEGTRYTTYPDVNCAANGASGDIVILNLNNDFRLTTITRADIPTGGAAIAYVKNPSGREYSKDQLRLVRLVTPA